jgi:hypothetical protein
MKLIVSLFIIVLTSCSHKIIKDHDPYFVYEDPQTHLFGFKNTEGDIVIPAEFNQAFFDDQQGYFTPENKQEGKFLAPVVKNGHWFRITKDGKTRIETVFHDNGADYYEEGLARFIERTPKGIKVGFYNKKGEIIIPARYDFAAPFRGGYALVANGCWKELFKAGPKDNDHIKKWGHYPPIESGGNIPVNYNSYSYGNLVGGQWSIIDPSGHEVVPFSSNHKEIGKIMMKLQAKSSIPYSR